MRLTSLRVLAFPIPELIRDIWTGVTWVEIIVGVDEVGRGSLVGPVYAAAVILNKNINKKILKDSKKLSRKKREKINNYIKKNSVWAIGKANINEIEKYNILNASLLAMTRAIKKIKKKPEIVLIDGNKLPKINNLKMKSVIKGDQKIPEISAASIIAKVSRDKTITNLSKKYKKYYITLNYLCVYWSLSSLLYFLDC